MPSAPARYCPHPGCPERVVSGRCSKHQRAKAKAYDRLRPSSGQRGYDVGWRKLRAMILASSPLCMDCQAVGRVTLATDVHHVAKLVDHPERRLDVSNLMPLCKACHGVRTVRGE